MVLAAGLDSFVPETVLWLGRVPRRVENRPAEGPKKPFGDLPKALGAQVGPMLAQVGPKLAKLPPHLARNRPKLAEVDRSWPQVGAKLILSWAKLVRNCSLWGAISFCLAP